MADATGADARVSDSIAQTNLLTLGQGAAVSVAQSYLAQSQAMAMLFMNAVQQQQQQGAVSLAVVTESLTKLLSGTRRRRTAKKPPPEQADSGEYEGRPQAAQPDDEQKQREPALSKLASFMSSRHIEQGPLADQGELKVT